MFVWTLRLIPESFFGLASSSSPSPQVNILTPLPPPSPPPPLPPPPQVDVLSKGVNPLEAPDRLVGRGRPLDACFRWDLGREGRGCPLDWGLGGKAGASAAPPSSPSTGTSVAPRCTFCASLWVTSSPLPPLSRFPFSLPSPLSAATGAVCPPSLPPSHTLPLTTPPSLLPSLLSVSPSSSSGGKLFAIGFDDGAVAVFGYHGWLRFHRGAVGAVRVLPERMQVWVWVWRGGAEWLDN